MTGIFVYALGKAIANIEDAQDRYKRDYDKKHHTTNVRMCNLYSILHAFVEQKGLFINIFRFYNLEQRYYCGIQPKMKGKAESYRNIGWAPT